MLDIEEAEAIRIRKAFVKNKPQTTVSISKTGLSRFEDYLAALQQVLTTAQKGLQAESKQPVPAGRAVMA